MDPNRGAAAPHEPYRGARSPGSGALRLVPLFGTPKWRPSKNERGAEHRSWMAVAKMGRRNNQPNDGVGCGGSVGEEMRTGGTRGGGRFLVVLGDELRDKKIKIERSMGPQISMASAGWDKATTNQKAAASLGFITESRRAQL